MTFFACHRPSFSRCFLIFPACTNVYQSITTDTAPAAAPTADKDASTVTAPTDKPVDPAEPAAEPEKANSGPEVVKDVSAAPAVEGDAADAPKEDPAPADPAANKEVQEATDAKPDEDKHTDTVVPAAGQPTDENIVDKTAAPSKEPAAEPAKDTTDKDVAPMEGPSDVTEKRKDAPSAEETPALSLAVTEPSSKKAKTPSP